MSDKDKDGITKAAILMLAMGEQVAEALVGLLGGAEAGELAHRPQAAPVHRGLDTAREREFSGKPDRVAHGGRRYCNPQP